MKNLPLLEFLFKKLSGSFGVSELGGYDGQTSKNIHILQPNDNDLNRIVVFYKDDKSIDKINFFSEKAIVCLNDLEAMFGQPKVGYSFRDDFTKIFFNKEMGVIDSVTTKKDHKLELIGNYVVQTTPKGEVFKFKPEENIFNSVCFSFNNEG